MIDCYVKTEDVCTWGEQITELAESVDNAISERYMVTTQQQEDIHYLFNRIAELEGLCAKFLDAIKSMQVIDDISIEELEEVLFR